LYSNEKNLELITPTTIEEKMALIEVIQNNYAYFIGVPSLKAELASINSKKMKKIFKLFKNFDPSSKVTREDLQNFSSELFILLKGPPVSLLDYFTENKTQRMGRRLYRVIQEEFLVQGLKNIILQFPEKEQYTMIENAKIFIGRVTRNKLWQLTSLPLDLPFINRLDLPSELLEKILLDGIEPHSTALLAHFKKQNMLDHYERFRTAYRTVAFGAFFIYFYHESKHKLYEQRKEAEEEIGRSIISEDNFLDVPEKLKKKKRKINLEVVA
jgi:hypothetical protein